MRKAKPGSSFGAKVNFVTSNFNKNNTSNYQDIIQTNSTSSINYSKSFLNNKLNVGINSNIYQDLSTGKLDLTLPQLTANLSRQIPFSKFKSKRSETLESFIKNLGFSYSGAFRNEISTGDSILISGVGEIFDPSTNVNTSALLDGFRNGVTHTIPVSTSFKALTWITVSPSFTFNEYWYTKSTELTYDAVNDSIIENNDVAGFVRGHSYRSSISFSTILYGQINTKTEKQRKLVALRHVVRPNLSAVYNPDFNSGYENGYRDLDTGMGPLTYSIFEDALMGRPTGGPQASLNFGVGNNLEMKVRSTKDTSNGGIKKVKLIESFNISSGYNFIADSLNLSSFSLRGNTTILNRIRMTFGGTFDPYAYDSARNRAINTFLIDQTGKLGHFTRANVSISTNLNPQALKKKESENIDELELEFINNNPGYFIDFTLPWSLSVNYNLNATNTLFTEANLRQTVTFRGDIKLTENWKLEMRSGYDFTQKELTLTSIDLHRNLHCWEMQFTWYPIVRQMFEFSIRVKSSTLQDLKLNRTRSWWNY